MNEEFHYRGQWWLPSEPGTSIGGELHFAPREGILLDLQGTLHPPGRSQGFRTPLVLGRTDSGKLVTLDRCHLRQSTTSFSGRDTSKLAAECAFVGTHFATPDQIRFRTVLVSYAYLNEWAGFQPIQVQHHKEFDSSQLEWHTRRLWLSDPSSDDYAGTDLSKFVDRYLVTARYEPPSPVRARLGDLDLAVVSYGSAKQTLGHLSLTNKVLLELSSVAERPFEDFLRALHHLRNFLTLAMASTTYPLELNGLTEGSRWPFDEGPGAYLPVQILYQQADLPVDSALANPPEMLFHLADIEESLDGLLANWLAQTETLGPVHDLYFSYRYNPHEYVRSAFLSLAQALESYHRRRFGGTYQSDCDYQTDFLPLLVSAIPASVQGDFRQHLVGGTLKYANEYSLRKRLAAITDRLSQAHAIPFLSATRVRSAFVSDVVEARNYLTHYDPKAGVGPKIANLFELVDKLDVILTICLLEELGLALDRVKNLLQKHHWYRERLKGS